MLAATMTPIEIVAEQTDWLVVNKPPHLLVHPTRPGGPITLLDLLRQLLAQEIAGGGQVSLIHRLDRETSGLLLVAKTHAAARFFSLAMLRGELHKEYQALVFGWPEWDQLTVDAPLLRQGERQPSAIWLKRMVHPAGAPARTRLTVLRRFERQTPAGHGRFSLVRAVPETGRLHQIRVHLAYAGFPLVGDKIYGAEEDCYLRFIASGWTPALAAALLLDRHALHAGTLTFPAGAGTTGAQLCTVTMPPDLAEFCAAAETREAGTATGCLRAPAQALHSGEHAEAGEHQRPG